MHIDLSELTDGFSSKLKVISFFLAVIKIKKLKKKLYIYEKKTKESPYLFTDHCLIKNFKLIKIKKKPRTKIVFNPYNYDSKLKELKSTNFIDQKKGKKFNLIADSSYRNFIPNKKTQKKVSKINLPKNFIGIHIRSTDRVVNIKNFIKKIQFKEMIFDYQIKNMVKNINNFIKLKSKINNIFICSDDKLLKNFFLTELQKKYNVYFNQSRFQKQKFRQTNGIDFISELFCLSRSKIIISTVGGAVTNTAYLISKKKIRIYKWTNILNIFFFCKIIVLIIFFSKKLKNSFIKYFFV
jgi:hypothetical protein